MAESEQIPTNVRWRENYQKNNLFLIKAETEQNKV